MRVTSNTGVDDDERQALQAEGLDPDDPAVIAAIDLCPLGTLARQLSHRSRPTGVLQFPRPWYKGNY